MTIAAVFGLVLTLSAGLALHQLAKNDNREDA